MIPVGYTGTDSGDYIKVTGLSGIDANVLKGAKALLIGCDATANGAWVIDTSGTPTIGYTIAADTSYELALIAIPDKDDAVDNLYILDNTAVYTFLPV